MNLTKMVVEGIKQHIISRVEWLNTKLSNEKCDTEQSLTKFLELQGRRNELLRIIEHIEKLDTTNAAAHSTNHITTAVKDELLRLYAEQEKYALYDNTIRIETLRWVLGVPSA